MPSAPLPVLMECLSELPDPRVERTRLHYLIDILTIGICAVICAQAIGAHEERVRMLADRLSAATSARSSTVAVTKLSGSDLSPA